VASQRVQNQGSADREANYCAERHQIDHRASHAAVVSEQRSGGEHKGENIQPKRRADLGQIAVEPDLEKNGGQSDCRDDDDGKRAKKRSAPREDDHHRQRQEQQAGSNHRPSAGYFRTRRRQRVALSGLAINPLYLRPVLARRLRASGHPFRRAIRAVRHGVQHQFHAAGNPHFVEDPQQVFLDRVLA